MDPQIKRVLNSTITLEPFIKRDGAGAPSYNPAVPLNCYPVYHTRMVRNLAGEEVVSMITLYFEATTAAIAIKGQDRITLPDDQQPPILAIQIFLDEVGNKDLVEVAL